MEYALVDLGTEENDLEPPNYFHEKSRPKIIISQLFSVIEYLVSFDLSWYDRHTEGGFVMDTEAQKHITAERVADTCNRIGGVPVSNYAKELSKQWVHGQISGEEMIRRSVEQHRRPK